MYRRRQQSVTVRNVTARLRGHSIPPFHVVFDKWEVKMSGAVGVKTTPKIATVGVWIDLEQLAKLARRAATNRSRKAQDGALHVELHYIQEVSHV